MPRFSTILVANRGEIACRVFRSAREKGYRTVAIYSDADAGAPHVKAADEAVAIGGTTASSSYLAIDRVIDACQQSGADAIHPGYGFLSENPAFAEACTEAGIVFIGPSAEAMRRMGNKAAAKRLMIDAGVPCVPGYEGDKQDDATMLSEAGRIGFPIMIKAAAGGGGRGMRVVPSGDGMREALASARSESKNAFGSDELLLERAVINPRHVEIQIIGDSHGNVIHLGERDCSVQRRHQKVIEESPCSVLDQATREAMGAAAVKAAQSAGYVGAGTVEFLLDENKNYYFLEMNTRLQVEHPVTEATTGLDLVALQLDVAQGMPLPLSQRDVRFSGHAIETRWYAEDACGGFLPQAGMLERVSFAQGGGVRIDHGVASHFVISRFYDPMIAKVIAHGANREEARRKLIHAMESSAVLGVVTNKDFLLQTLESSAFASSEATTGFVEKFWTDDRARRTVRAGDLALAGAILVEASGRNHSPLFRGWRSSGVQASTIVFEHGDERFRIRVVQDGPANYRAETGREAVSISIVGLSDGEVTYMAGGPTRRAVFAIAGDTIHLDLGRGAIALRDVTYEPASERAVAGDGVVRSPMSGLIVRVNVQEGDAVTKGQVLLVVEAMKMQNQVVAAADGVVDRVSAREGDQVETRAVLVTMKRSEA